jgi:ferredoxin
MALLHVTDRAGRTHSLDTVEGWRVMEILRDHGTGIDGLCGGACACATCHVIIADNWAHRLPPAREEEERKLDELPLLSTHSRLSCQIIWDDALDGLQLTLAEAL